MATVTRMGRHGYTPAQLAAFKRKIDRIRDKPLKTIAKRVGISVELATAIRNDTVDEYRRRLQERRKESESMECEPRDAYYSRCPSCRGLVLMPCLACKMERLKGRVPA